jgi:hypothetical protein
VVALTGVSAANDACNRAASSTAPTATSQYEQARLDFDSAKNQTQLGWTIAGVGAGVLLGGALLVVISPDRKTSGGLDRMAPWIAAHAGGVRNFGCVVRDARGRRGFAHHIDWRAGCNLRETRAASNYRLIPNCPLALSTMLAFT